MSARNAERVAALTMSLDAIAQEREETNKVLASALWACNTQKQLASAYPSLVPYLPKAAPATKALAVTNDVVKKALNS